MKYAEIIMQFFFDIVIYFLTAFKNFNFFITPRLFPF
jgi:hypothetical protein